MGDGGSRVLEQVAEQRTRITDGLAGVRHLVAVGSGKGGVGKSTLTLHLAGALRARGLRVAILDAGFHRPPQGRLAGGPGGRVRGGPRGPPPRGPFAPPAGFGLRSSTRTSTAPHRRAWQVSRGRCSFPPPPPPASAGAGGGPKDALP